MALSPALDVGMRGDPDNVGTLLAELRRRAPGWFAAAACRDSHLDFTSTGRSTQSQCIQVCGRCPVRLDCRAFADETGDTVAVLGGETASARTARRRATTTTEEQP